MKKIFTILLTAGAACIFSETASAQSLKNLFNKDNIKDVVENVTGLDLSKEDAVITGTWKFSGTAVELESKDFLKKAAAKLAVETIEKKLDETITKIGVAPGLFSFTFNADKTFSIGSKKREIKGTYTLSADKKKLTLTFGRLTKLGTMDVITDLGSKELSLMFKAANFIDLLGKVTSEGGSDAMKTLATLVSAYDGINIGFELSR